MSSVPEELPSVMEMESRRFARSYANLGWYITPLNGKKPFHRNWPKSATSNETNSAKWLSEGRNLGLVTGTDSGVVVIDVDPRNGGNESFEELLFQCGDLPETVVCNTGGGGQHYYFRYFDGSKSCKPLAGIDFQSEGRCVVLPPSVHPDTGALYYWENRPEEGAIAELPESWKQALCNPSGMKPSTQKSNSETIISGQRNDTLFAIAVSHAKTGSSESKISRIITEENALRCVVPLDNEELRSIVRASLKYRQGNLSALTRFQQAVGYADMPTARKAALWSLGLFADQHGRNCYPTIEQIADRSGMARETAGRHLAVAEKEGWVTRITHSRSTGPGFNYSYLLKIPPI